MGSNELKNLTRRANEILGETFRTSGGESKDDKI